jgi:hypothetical protein
LATNPRALVPDDIWPVLRLWSWCRGEFGLTHLPDSGGVNDQASWVMDAFAILAEVDAELREAEKPQT